jgi:alpha-glucosidase (family GH31 glycosyl hydrolase)
MKTQSLAFINAILILVFVFSSLLGKSQYSLDFNGEGDYVALNGTDIAPPWTLEVMVNKNETDNYQHLITGTDGNSGIRLEQWWGTQVGFTHSGVMDWYFNYTCPIGQWIPLAITNTGTVTKLYVNGTLNSSVNASINFPMKWISKNTSDASLKSKVDELRIWNIVLSDNIILQYAGQPVEPTHPNYANLLHYYKFDEGSGNICYDSKGTLNGTIYGAVYYFPTNHDAGVLKLVAPENSPDNYSFEEPLIVRVKNYGAQNITEDFNISYTLEGNLQEIKTIPAGTTPLQSNQTIDVEFTPVNMNTSGSYHFKFFTSLSNDENLQNDTLTKTLVSVSNVIGNITAFTVDTCTALITCGSAKVRVIFYKEDLFRIWLAPNGNFSNPAGNNIVVSYDFPLISVNWSDEGTYYKIFTSELVLRAYKNPLKFALYQSDNITEIWTESYGLDYGTRTFQYLETDEEEYFYGGGMQNGYFSHKGTKIKISKETENWDNGAVPNPVPFYMSTKGYGAFRNTFAPGSYDFRENNYTQTAHQENRFDCFYFYGPSLKEILNGYTELTGRPSLIPRWGLELGDADCYNLNGQTTMDVVELVADPYRENDLPGGWILPNDGYGCGYTDLPDVVSELHERGFWTGLWTEDGVSQIAWEVGTAGTRACKLDVAWVGSGYLIALNACKAAYEGIESNCNDRAFVWSVCGWAGTQRYSTVWSGDQSGNFEYIRFHIPTFIGSGLSGYNYASSDVDGIFGGNSVSYARDLQWKTFIPVTYCMSGWATNDKHPWNYGTAITDINRNYLKLKMRLTPYLYTYCNEAYETGTPVVRAMLLEYPDDPNCQDKTTQYQFMSGEWFLVAPVYKPAMERDSIYFPAGKWIDYWNGTVYEGPLTLNDYPADLSKCPVFVKAGAIIPMYPEMLYDNQYPKDPVTFDIYPNVYSESELYEDDGISREHRSGAFSKTLITVEGPEYGGKEDITITVGESVGSYAGKPYSRAYIFQVHVDWEPDDVIVNDTLYLTEYLTFEDWEQAAEGWFFDNSGLKDIIYAKTLPLSLNGPFTVLFTSITSAKKLPNENFIRIFPNPSTGIVQISAGDDSILQVSVFDINGRTVTEQVTVQVRTKYADVDLSSMPNGFYFIEVKTAEGTISRKISLLK